MVLNFPPAPTNHDLLQKARSLPYLEMLSQCWQDTVNTSKFTTLGNLLAFGLFALGTGFAVPFPTYSILLGLGFLSAGILRGVAPHHYGLPGKGDLGKLIVIFIAAMIISGLSWAFALYLCWGQFGLASPETSILLAISAVVPAIAVISTVQHRAILVATVLLMVGPLAMVAGIHGETEQKLVLVPLYGLLAAILVYKGLGLNRLYWQSLVHRFQAQQWAGNLEIEHDAKSVFVANMSHELRTPLNAVIGMTRLTLNTELTAIQRNYLKSANSAAYSLLNIVEDILDFSQLDTGLVQPNLSVFEPAGMIKRVASMVAENASNKQVVLEAKIEPELPHHLIGDERRLTQILVNLAGNAVKFTQQGEVTIFAELRDSESETPHLYCSVADSGIGISSDHIAKIFDPFTQADSSNTRRYGGTGLGLSICKKLINIMSGEITAESVPGRGSLFHFTVPVSIPLGSASPPEAVPAEQTVQSPRILIAEDNIVNQQIARAILEKAGLTVDVVANGALAVDKVAASHDDDDVEQDFDAVLMDIQMPEMDGIEATRKIREDTRNRDLPIIALTAHATAEDRQKCLASGMSDFLSKPIDDTKLLETLHSWVAFGSTQDSETVPHSKPLPAPAGIDMDALLKRIGGNQKLADKLLLSFVQTHRDMAREVKSDLEQQREDKALSQLHNLKGLAGNLSATRLHLAAVELEQALIENSDTNFPQQLAELEEALDEIVSAVGASDLARKRVSTSALTDTAALHQCIGEMETYLTRSNVKALDTMVRLRELLGSEGAVEPLLADLESCLDRLEMDDAREVLGKIQEWAPNRQ